MGRQDLGPIVARRARLVDRLAWFLTAAATGYLAYYTRGDVSPFLMFSGTAFFSFLFFVSHPILWSYREALDTKS